MILRGKGNTRRERRKRNRHKTSVINISTSRLVCGKSRIGEGVSALENTSPDMAMLSFLLEK